MEYELVKIVCQAVIAKRENGQIVGEDEAPPRACYTLEEILAYRGAIAESINEANAAASAEQNGDGQLEALPGVLPEEVEAE